MTVKNLNSIMFEEEKGDTPMALLRGIKFGTESYHVLFKRLCRCELIVKAAGSRNLGPHL